MFHKSNEKLSVSGGSRWQRRSSRKAAAALLAALPAEKGIPNAMPGSRVEAQARASPTLPGCATTTAPTSGTRSPERPGSAWPRMGFAAGPAPMGSPSTRPGFCTTAGLTSGLLGWPRLKTATATLRGPALIRIVSSVIMIALRACNTLVPFSFESAVISPKCAQQWRRQLPKFVLGYWKNLKSKPATPMWSALTYSFGFSASDFDFHSFNSFPFVTIVIQHSLVRISSTYWFYFANLFCFPSFNSEHLFLIFAGFTLKTLPSDSAAFICCESVFREFVQCSNLWRKNTL